MESVTAVILSLLHGCRKVERGSVLHSFNRLFQICHVHLICITQASKGLPKDNHKERQVYLMRMDAESLCQINTPHVKLSPCHYRMMDSLMLYLLANWLSCLCRQMWNWTKTVVC